MNVDLCKSCMYFRPLMMDEQKRMPCHCTCIPLAEVFGLPDGFPSGIDIIHCFYHQQYPLNYGDFQLIAANNEGVSYIIKRNHQKKRVPDLFDNSQNIKTRYLYDSGYKQPKN